MEDRRIQLIAAAAALRGWVHAQKAARDSVPALAVTSLPMPAFVLSLSGGAAPVNSAPAAADWTPASFAEPSVSASTLRRQSPGPAPSIRGIVQSAARLLSLARAPVSRLWKPAAASLAVVAMVGVARSSLPQWSALVSAQLRSAGQHVTVFDRPAQSVAPRPAAVKPATGTGRRSGSLHVESNPSGAHVVIDGGERGVTPLTVSELSVGSHAVALSSDGGTVRRAITIGAGKTTQLNEAIYSGWLHVSSSLDLQLSENGRGLRLDDSSQLLLSPGSHDLRFENRRVAFVDTRSVEIRPGDTTNISVEPPASTLSVTASTPSEVLVDGVVVGGTPLSGFAIAVGTRDIIVRSVAGERRQTLMVTLEPINLAIDFER